MQECGSNISGRAGVSRGAQPGPGIAPNQAILGGVSGFQADFRFKAIGNSPHAQGVSHYPKEAQGNYVVDGAIDTHLLLTDPIGAQRDFM